MKLKYLFLSLFASSGLSGLIDGVPDASFGSDGQVVTQIIYAEDFTRSLAIQSDNKILISPYAASNFLVARYAPDGSLDTSFGVNGVATSIQGGATNIVIQPDGKIVAGGVFIPNGGFGLTRYTPNGLFDTTFQTMPASSITGTIFDVALQADGKIIAIGNDSGIGLIARFNTDGTIDTTFQLVSTTLGFDAAYFNAIRIQNDGKIVVAGTVASGSNDFMLIARYLTDGQLDTTFANAGFATLNITGFDLANALVIQPNGYSIIAGQAGDTLAMARFTPGGLLDLSFGRNGIVTSPNTITLIVGMALQSDDKIVTVGFSNFFNAGIIARFTNNGQLDTSFNGVGYNLANNGGFYGVACNSLGKIIAGELTQSSVIALNQYVVDSLHYSPLSQAIWKVYYNQVN